MSKVLLTDESIGRVALRKKPYDVYDSDLSCFYLRVQPSGTKSYYVVYRTTEGRQRRYRIGNAARLGADQARAEARRILGRVDLGEDPAESRQKLKSMSNAETLREFIAAHFAPHVLLRLRSAASTLWRIERHFQFLMDRNLHQIMPQDILAWQTDQIRNGRSPSTINRDLASLRSCLTLAVALDFINKSPCDKVRDIYMFRDERDRETRAIADKYGI